MFKWKMLKYLAAVVIVVLVFFFIFDVPDSYYLGKRGVTVNAKITKYDPDSDDTFYEYAFNGTTFYYKYAYHIGANSRYPKPGDSLIVTIDPDRPARHSLGQTSEVFSSNIQEFAVVVFVVLSVLFWRILLVRE